MSTEARPPLDVLRAVWAAEGRTGADLDEECGPTKTCRNMKDVSFDAMAEPGTDLRTAWKERLRQEGKFNQSAGQVADWVLDTPPAGR